MSKNSKNKLIYLQNMDLLLILLFTQILYFLLYQYQIIIQKILIIRSL